MIKFNSLYYYDQYCNANMSAYNFASSQTVFYALQKEFIDHHIYLPRTFEEMLQGSNSYDTLSFAFQPDPHLIKVCKPITFTQHKDLDTYCSILIPASGPTLADFKAKHTGGTCFHFF